MFGGRGTSYNNKFHSQGEGDSQCEKGTNKKNLSHRTDDSLFSCKSLSLGNLYCEQNGHPKVNITHNLGQFLGRHRNRSCQKRLSPNIYKVRTVLKNNIGRVFSILGSFSVKGKRDSICLLPLGDSGFCRINHSPRTLL